MSRRTWLSWLTSPFLPRMSATRRRHPTLLAAVPVCLLEDRRLLSATINVGNLQYQIAAVVNDPSQVLFTGGTAKGQDWGNVPQKSITFTNNSTDKQTIYPFLYSPNTTQIYDPIDPNNEEYREYVGYTLNGQNYLGLPYGESITISVPLVFWNGARADIATDGANLLPQPNQVSTLNPFQFYYSKNGVNASIYIGTKGVVASTDNGILMYYHSHDNGQPNDPNAAAAGQLTEWTIRDQDFLTKVNTYDQQHGIGTIASSELTTLINYDVSYVDDLMAPVAMEATQVPIPINYIESGTATSVFANGQTTTTIALHDDAARAFLLDLLTTQPNPTLKPSWQVSFDKSLTETIAVGTVTNVNTSTGTVTIVQPGNVTGLPGGLVPFVFSTRDVKQDFGWTGAQNSISNLQTVVTNFTSDNPQVNGLGQYFGGAGWPEYYNPGGNLIKIPGGANILANSPLTDQRSPYNQQYFLLTSNGAYQIEYGALGLLDPAKQTLTAGSTVTFKMSLSSTFNQTDLQAMKGAQDNQKATWDVYFNNQLIGTINKDTNANNDNGINPTAQTVTVTLSQTIANLPSGYALDFRAAVNDPYSTQLRNLWYSWANYYVNLPQFANLSPQVLSATVSADTDSAADTRVLTFSQAQPQLALGMEVTGAGITGPVTILKISSDAKTIYLSAPVPVTTTSFTFSKPQMVSTYGDPNVNLNLIKADQFGADTAFAEAFAASVYETMAVYSTIQNPTVPQLPRSMGVVYESIGGGVGHLPTSAFVNISADVRDLGKSVLRGVPDFNNYPNTYTPDSQWKPGDWYPPPSKNVDDAGFNVFNLDPYVWFVHQKLHLSGYGFSFDDDASDIGADGTSTLSIDYSGLTGLTNKLEWFASTPWGTVNIAGATISLYAGSDPKLAGSTIVTLPHTWKGIIAYNQIRPDDPANAMLGAYLDGAGIIANQGQNSFTRVHQLLDSNALTLVITQAPNRKLPYTTDLTFTGTPPKVVNRPGPNSRAGNTLQALSNSTSGDMLQTAPNSQLGNQLQTLSDSVGQSFGIMPPRLDDSEEQLDAAPPRAADWSI